LDLATVLELACIGKNWATATRVLPKAILAATASFETATTLGNLRLLKQEASEQGAQSRNLMTSSISFQRATLSCAVRKKLNPA
jgi:hypothetical protein